MTTIIVKKNRQTILVGVYMFGQTTGHASSNWKNFVWINLCDPLLMLIRYGYRKRSQSEGIHSVQCGHMERIPLPLAVTGTECTPIFQNAQAALSQMTRGSKYSRGHPATQFRSNDISIYLWLHPCIGCRGLKAKLPQPGFMVNIVELFHMHIRNAYIDTNIIIV